MENYKYTAPMALGRGSLQVVGRGKPLVILRAVVYW
jgi:hypothetical protein